MHTLQFFDSSAHAFTAGGSHVLPQVQAGGSGVSHLVQGAEKAVQVYSRASEAYTGGLVAPSVAFWALLIAAGFVLLEWVVARRGRH
jgi:hypothetical protein